MHLFRLIIQNFRGIKHCEIFLNKHTVLLGANNIGKSSIIDSIGLLLGKDKLVRTLSDYDFLGGSPGPADRILIKGLIGEFGTNEPSKHPQWFNDHNGGIPIWYNPQSKKCKYGDPEDGLILCTEIAFCARFDEDELEYHSFRYFVESNSDPFEEENNLKRLNSTQIKELGFFLMPSNRTWERIISFGSELFRKVVKFQEAVPGKTVVGLRNDLRATDKKIEKQKPLSEIVERINNELAGFMGNNESGLNFLPTYGDIESTLQCLTPFLPGKLNTNLPLGRHGSGIISLQTLLLLLEFGKFRKKQNQNFVLAIEEPEIHLQPNLHRRLVNRIRGLTDQSIVTTHSPEIAAYYRPTEIMILKNNDGDLNSYILSEDVPRSNAIMRLFTIYRTDICEALMNKLVLIPEGLTEFRWFKLLMTSCVTAEGWEFYESEVPYTRIYVILPTQDAKVVETYNAFSKLVESLMPIIDGDTAGDLYLKELAKLENPPSIIFQLPKDLFLEHVIAWILSPIEKEDYLELQILFASDINNYETLVEKLISQKSNWLLHEKVMMYITQTKESFIRAQSFINSISLVEGNSSSAKCYWEKSKAWSTTKSSVYQLVLK